MIHLTRDKKTGNYYTQDDKFMIDRGTIGWNVHVLTSGSSEILGIKFGPMYEYYFSCDTLREVRESLEYEYKK